MLRFLLDHNPFYLLSVFSMLGGFYTFEHALDPKPENFGTLLLLAGTLQLYEVVLIGLGLYLIVRRGLTRDGRLLLLLESVFLVDASYFGAVCFTADRWWGLWVNVALLALAAGKLAAIGRILRLPYTVREFAFIVSQLALLFAAPGFFRWMARWNPLPVWAIYAVWWAAGVSIAVRALAASSVGRGGAASRAPAVDAPLRAALDVLPFASLLARLIAASWIYQVPFQGSNVAPVLLGLAIACARCGPAWASTPWRVWIHLALPLVAVGLSMRFPDTLVRAIPGVSAILLSPWRAALMGAALVYAHGLWVHRHAVFAWASGACALAALSGHSLAAVGQTLAGLGRKMASLVPETSFQWGVAAIAAAFALLWLGAVVSLWPSGRDSRNDALRTPPSPVRK